MEKIKQFKVERGGRSMTVLIPGSGDKEYDKYLEEAEKEKTAHYLENLTPQPKRAVSKEDVGKALKEFSEHLKRRKDSGKKYY